MGLSDKIGQGYGYEGYGDLAILGYYGNVGGLSPAVGAHHVQHPHHMVHHPAHAHPAMHAQHPAGAMAPHMPYAPQVLARMVNPMPGTPAHGTRYQPLPLLNSAFVAGGLTTQPWSVSPQRQFQGRRLGYSETRTGASATGLTTISNFAVGQTLEFVGAGAIGTALLGPNAYDLDLKIDACGPGVNITGNVNISANPTMTDRVDFSLALWGEALG